MPNDLLQKTLTVTVGADTYEFNIPSLHSEIGIGSRMTTLRKKIDPDWDGFSQGMDGSTAWALRACATFEILLSQSSARWPFTETAGKVLVDSSTFPPDKVTTALEVYQGYETALNTFRQGGVVDKKPVGAETVAG